MELLGLLFSSHFQGFGNRPISAIISSNYPYEEIGIVLPEEKYEFGRK
ncbi:MAG: hypothetical protein VZQ80_06800 [Lachnospiraceae bacterium]|nr:hypothetical protein [Lachnospiraceae bacterium]